MCTVHLLDSGREGPRDVYQQRKDRDAVVWNPRNPVNVLKGIWVLLYRKAFWKSFLGSAFMWVLRWSRSRCLPDVGLVLETSLLGRDSKPCQWQLCEFKKSLSYPRAQRAFARWLHPPLPGRTAASGVVSKLRAHSPHL